MNSKLISLAAIYMAIAIGCGAFGAHALRDRIPPQDLLIWEKAVLYHLVHALAVIVLGSIGAHIMPQRRSTQIATLILTSITIFSGTLYLLVLLNQRWLGAITPIGGGGLIASWLLFAYSVNRNTK